MLGLRVRSKTCLVLKAVAYEEEEVSIMNYYTASQKPRKRVFISFHMGDRHAKELLVAQGKSDKFDLEFINYAVNEPFDSEWRTNCRERIKQTSVTICLIGEKTWQRKAVVWELNTSYELGNNVFGVRIYRSKNHTVPEPLRRNNAKILYWDVPDIVRELNG